MNSKFWKDRLIALTDEIAAFLIITAGGGIIYSLWLIFQARLADLGTFVQILSVILPLLLLVLFAVYVWQRRGRFAVQRQGRVLDERLLQKGRYFVGRHDLRDKFARAIDPKGFALQPLGSGRTENPKGSKDKPLGLAVDRLFAIHGIGGIGKSSVIEEFRRMCYRRHVPFAYGEGSVIHNEIDALKAIHEQLAESMPFNDFQAGLDRYHKLQAKLTEHPDISPKVIQMLSKGLVVAASAAPGGKAVAEAIGAENVEVALSAIYRLLSREDAKFFLNPEQELTDYLVDDLNEYLANSPLALFFDTYEQMETLDDWLRTRLVERLGKQAVVAIAGRNPLKREWGYTAIVRQELRELASDETAAYLREKGISDDKTVNDIVAFTGGLPLALSLVDELLRAYPNLNFADLPKEKDVITVLVEQMLRTAPADMRGVLEVCAALRWFNTDILAYMLDIDPSTSSGQVQAKELFARLQKLDFVIQKGKRLALHDQLRTFMEQNAKFVDEKGYLARHQKAMGYFEKQLDIIQSDPKSYLEATSEKILHLSIIDELTAEKSLISKCNEFYLQRKIEYLNLMKDEWIPILNFTEQKKRDWTEYLRAMVLKKEGNLAITSNIFKKLMESDDDFLRSNVVISRCAVIKNNLSYFTDIKGQAILLQQLQHEVESAIERLARQFNYEGVGVYIWILADLFYEQHQKELAIQTYQRAVSFFEGKQQTLEYLNSLYLLADKYYLYQEYEKSLRTFIEVRDKSIQGDYIVTEAMAIIGLGKVYYGLKEVDKSLENVKLGLEKCKKITFFGSIVMD